LFNCALATVEHAVARIATICMECLAGKSSTSHAAIRSGPGHTFVAPAEDDAIRRGWSRQRWTMGTQNPLLALRPGEAVMLIASMSLVALLALSFLI